MNERILKISLVAVLLSLAIAAPAQAGRYHVYSCRMPDGGVAPTDGWSGTKSGGPSRYVTNTANRAARFLPRWAIRRRTREHGSIATWTFAGPAGETLVGATLWRAGDAFGGSAVNASFQFWLSAPKRTRSRSTNVSTALGCPDEGTIGDPFAARKRGRYPTAKPGSHTLLARSRVAEPTEASNAPTGQGDPNNYAAALYLYAADLTLEQTAGPTVSAVGGELASASTVTGTTDVTFTASDPGAGVYETVFSVDGKVVQASVPDEAGGSCRNVGQTTDGLPAFLHLQPCPASVSADVGFDTLDADARRAPPVVSGPRRGRQLGAGPRPDDHGPRHPGAGLRSRAWRGSRRVRRTASARARRRC